MSSLGLVEATSSWQHARLPLIGRVRHETRTVGFLEWTVGGVPLRALLAEHAHEDARAPQQEMTCLTEPSTEAVAYLDRLLGVAPGEFDDGRVTLLLCPIDGDLECGAVTARLVLDNEAARWADLGWQSPSDAMVDRFDPPVTFDFDRGAYFDLLSAARDRFDPDRTADPPG